MKIIQILLVVIVTLVSATACDKDDDNNGNGNGNNIVNEEDTFTGTATTTIEYWEYDVNTGNDVFIEEKTFTYPVYVYTSPPMSLEGVDETNPFNLQIYPDRDNNEDEEGHVDLTSCLIIDDIMVGKVIMQYWDFSLSGATFSGTLTDTHIAESAASNLVWCMDDVAGIQMVMPYYMATGTSMNGTIDSENFVLDLEGQSTDTYRKFTCHIEATTD